MQLSAKTEKELAEFVAQFRHDPFGFVMAAYPWGLPGPLAGRTGPEEWQKQFLLALGRHSLDNAYREQLGIDMKVWRSAVASGHGVGKSALVAWLIQWIMSTRPNARGIVTANTGDQLESRTWPELGKWHDMLINRHWFSLTATSYYFAQYPEDKRKNYMVTAQTVSPERTEAFAGLHNDGSAVFIIKDEASGIDRRIWDVSQGAFTDGEGFDINFGNPTKPDGAFFDCFEKHREEMSYLAHVDSRTVSHTNKHALEQIIRMHGPESNEAKIRVYGQFPNQAFDGFLSVDAVRTAMTRELHPDKNALRVLGVDVARFGDDSSVFFMRQGRDARSFPRWRFKGLDTKTLTDHLIKYVSMYKPDAIVLESIGPGVGIIDTMRALRFPIREVHPGAKAKRDSLFHNRRAELWSAGRDAIIENLVLEEDPELLKQLTTIKYSLQKDTGRQIMQSKKDMKAEGLPSPDDADALMLTFDLDYTARRTGLDLPSLYGLGGRAQAITEYDELAY